MAYSLLSAEYSSQIRPKIRQYMDLAATGMATELKESITDKAYENVYSYQASPWAMKARRYALLRTDDEALRDHYEQDADSVTVLITSVVKLQSGGDGEVDIVESGDRAYRQPYPRPFMEEGLKAYISSGRPESVLRNAMAAAGFDVF